jgi:hypothetical protein
MPKGANCDYFNFGDDTEGIEEIIIDFYQQNPQLWQLSDPKYKLGKEKPLIIQRLLDNLSKPDLQGRPAGQHNLCLNRGLNPRL